MSLTYRTTAVISAAIVSFSSPVWAQDASGQVEVKAEAEAGGDGDIGGGTSGGGDNAFLDGELEGLRAHVGAIFGGGPSHADNTSGNVVGSLLFAFKGGIFFDRIEAGLEFAPATFVTSFNPDVPAVHLNAYAGYHIPLYRSISWPIRAGIGFTSPIFNGEVATTGVAFRGDFIGASMLVAEQFILDVYLPSFRVNYYPDASQATFTYIFGIGGAWAPTI